MIGKVQECGCIALPEALQQQTGLYPGATYQIEIAPQGAGLLLLPLETAEAPEEIKPGTRCG
jgi:hypothetical protein